MRPSVSTATLIATLALALVCLAAAARPTARGGGGSTWWAGWSARELEGELARELGTGPDIAGWAPLVQLLAAAALIVVIVVVARRLLRRIVAGRLARRSWRARVAPASGRVRWAADAAYGDELARAAKVGADDLDVVTRPGGSPWAISDAVVAAWVRLESVSADLGANRRTQDTAAEFAADLVARRRVAPEAIEGLLGLYGRARFSDEQLDISAGQAARDALARVHGDLVGAIRQ